MHKEVLNKKQIELLELVKYFSKMDFFLAGGTSLALQLGYRESIDFDMFSNRSFDNLDIYKEIKGLGFDDIRVVVDKLDEYTIFLNDVKITFLMYPFKIKDINEIEGIRLVDPLTIASMKAYALGRRSKWKDYVDLYMLFQTYSIKDVIEKSEEIFGSIFSEKMFRQQLCYFDGIDFSEKVYWRIDKEPSEKEIKDFLKDVSVNTDEI